MRRIQVFEGPGKGIAKLVIKHKLVWWTKMPVWLESHDQWGQWYKMKSERQRKSQRILKIMAAIFSFIPNAMGYQGDQLDFKEIKPVNPKGS